jgi:hypothetical protein
MDGATSGLKPTERNVPFFVKPAGFRPNSHFVGRESELQEMHKILFDQKARAEGTSAVVLQCLPGGGKSHLAREFVYRYMNDFPGGIFWIRAKSKQELLLGFWDIAQRASIDTNVDKYVPFTDPNRFVTAVHEWLCSSHGWLLVLDGFRFDSVDEMRQFLPNSSDSSLIYTSTAVPSSSRQLHFLDPQVIKVPLLSASEAQQLLLLEIEKHTPTSQDLESSMKLVQHLGYLPLAIHTVARRLVATQEPLARFAKSYAKESRLRGLGAFSAVVDQLVADGAVEALNLIKILCFFDQHVPIELLAVGKSINAE